MSGVPLDNPKGKFSSVRWFKNLDHISPPQLCHCFIAREEFAL